MSFLERVGLIGLIGLIGFLLGRCTSTAHSSKEPDEVVVRDTLTVVRIDTIRETETRLVREEVLRVDTIYLDWPADEPVGFDDVGGFDDDRVAVVTVQRTYAGDYYRAWVSGPMLGSCGPVLDSIDVEREIVETVVTVKEKERRKRWGMGVNAGYGFGRGGIGPYVGVCVSYNLATW